MTTEGDIERAGKALAEAARSPARVILFGSRARGDATTHSDFDFLVIEREVDSAFDEMVRLSRLLGRHMHIPADVVVVSEAHVEEWGEVRGTMVHAALTEGRVLAEA